MYAAFGASSPFWPAFFENKALTTQQIGLILSAGIIIRLAAGPLTGRLADVSGSLRAVLAACAVLGAATAAAFLLSNSLSSLLIIALLQGAALALMASLADALAVNVASPRLAGKAFEYGWIRGLSCYCGGDAGRRTAHHSDQFHSDDLAECCPARGCGGCNVAVTPAKSIKLAYD